jgi:fatty acid desaturase
LEKVMLAEPMVTTAEAVATPATDTGGPARGSLYSTLLRQVRSAGLLDRRSAYYVRKIVLTGLMLAAGWTAFAMLGDSWWQVGVAVFMAFTFTQIGFLGHDAGHRQVFSSRRANYTLGLLCANLAIGLSYGWWIDKHNRHHAHPNDPGSDPDVQVGAFAFTPEQAALAGPLRRIMYRYQAFLFFPLLLLEALNLHVASLRALLGRTLRNHWQETALFAVHFAAYFSAVFVVLAPVHALVFIAVHQGVFGLYLGCSFAPNHKGMPALDTSTRVGYLHRQVLTSRNVRGSRMVDFVLGGLNYQIEHHLFPSMPRPNLRRSQRIIRTYCRQHGIAYCETGLLRSYAQALTHLRETGRAPEVSAR